MHPVIRSVALPCAALLGAAMLLGGCSSKPASQEEKVEQAVKAASQGLPKPNPDTPDSAYVALTSGKQIMFLHEAVSGVPTTYDYLAGETFPEYRSTGDAFKKHDMLASLQPKLDAMIADAKAHPYVTWTDTNEQLEHYDFSQHTFHDISQRFQGIGVSGLSFPDELGYTLAVSNGQEFQELHVTDDAKARAIEAFIGKWPGLTVKVYAFVQGIDTVGYPGTPSVQASITKIQVLGPQGQVLLEQKASQ